MSYFILMGRRIPKQAITGFKFQNETDNIRPFLSIRIRGKDEIIPFKDKKEIQSVKAHLCSIFSGFVKIGDWYLKMSEVKEYKPVTAEDMNPYILFKTSKFGNIKVRFPKDEDMDAELLVLDQLFDVVGFFRQLTGITIEGAFNRCSACVEIMANDDNGVSMMHYIDYEDIIGVELIKN